MQIDQNTQIGADGQRYPTGTAPGSSEDVEAANRDVGFLDELAEALGDIGITSVRDTLANLEADATVYAAGRMLQATDVPVFAIANGTDAFVDLDLYASEGGRVLDIAISTTGASAQSTLHTITDLADISFDVVTGKIVVVTLTSGFVSASAGNIAVGMSIADASNVDKVLVSGTLGTTTLTNFRMITMPPAREVLTTPGSYTRRGRMQRLQGTPTFSYDGAATTPTVLMATEYTAA